jgi:Zn-dependent peptidase ImmA (M78 family)/DNA-binding XRE family transcriptional regulator
MPGVAGIDRQSLGENMRRLRNSKGLSQNGVADLAGISVPAYRSIENGGSTPKLETLKLISEALDTTIVDLLREVRIPKEVRFRARKTIRIRNEILSEVARSLEMYSEIQSIVDYQWEDPYIDDVRDQLKGMRKKKKLEMAAHYLREKWELGEDEPIRNISGLFYKHGIKVLSIPKSSTEFFGLSVSEADLGPAVAVNTWERISVERWIFSAAHELGHLILHLKAFDVDQTEENGDEEREADQFASYFLMPREAFHRELSALRGMHWIDTVLSMKRIFKVSWKTVVMRLLEEKMVKDNVWREFHIQYKQKYNSSLRDHREPSPLQAEEFASSFAAEEPDNLRKTDFPVNQLESLVSLALDQEKITMSKAAEVMGLSVNKMREVASGWEMQTVH